MGGIATDDYQRAPTRAVAITVNDTTDVSRFTTLGFRVGTGGTLVVRPRDSDADVTLSNVANGELVRLCVSQIKATGTTASGIVGFCG